MVGSGMDLRRVVGVTGPEAPGSGYVLGERLVLTSAHVVGGVGGAVEVFFPGRAGRFAGVVLWQGAPGGRDDAALLRITDAGWVPPAGAGVRWGRTVTHRPGIRCVTCGLPEVVQRPGRGAEMLQPSGTLNPGDRYVGDRYLVSLDQPAPRDGDGARGGDGSPWGGLSGAALFCDDLLVGVIAADPAGWGHGRLEATPAYVLHRDPGFRAALAELADRGLGPVPVLEPVEWAGLADVGEVAPAGALTGSPAELLRARREVAPFRGRAELLAKLRSWAGSGTGAGGCGVWLLHGPGGQGKTRVAARLAGELSAAGWVVLWLSRDAAEVSGLKDAAVPLLLIVDYAETRPGQVAAAVEAIARHGGASPIRVLLLARTADSWWQSVQETSSATEALLGSAVVTRLPVVDADPAGRGEAYREAVEAFGTALPALPGQQGIDWAGLAERVRDPAPTGLVTALTVQMQALADLLDAAHPGAGNAGNAGGAARNLAGLDPGGAGSGGVEDRLLIHERRYWRKVAAARGLDQSLSWGTLIDALAAGVLVSAGDRDQADALLCRVAGLADQPRDRRDSVREWIASLYPPAPARPWGTLEPDRLAERFIGRHLHTDPGFAARLVEACTSEQATQLLTVYARAAAHTVFAGALNSSLARLVTDHSAPLAIPAAQVATQVEAPRPLLDALGEIADDSATPVDQLTRLADRLPHPSHVLAEYAAHLSQRITEHYREQADTDPDAFLPDLAGSLNDLSVRLGELGRREEGLEAITEAVEVYRRLADARPDAFLPDLAGSLNNLSVDLGALGRREEGLEASTEAVEIRRRLADARPDAFLPALATSLNNLSIRLGELGRREEGLEAITEAVEIRRRLADARPDAFLPALATSLNNLSNRLGDLGRREEGLEAITEAVEIRRRLADARPDAFLPDLATSLNNLSVDLGALGRREEGLEASTEAVEVYRRLADARPDAFLPDLAMSLNNLSIRLGELGRREEGLEAITEAVEIRRRLADARPDAFLPALATSLNNLSIRLGELGRREEGLEAITEAVEIRRRLADARPDAFLPALATSLNNLSIRLGELGRREEGLEAITEAVEVYRRLADARPDAFLPALAGSLNNLSIDLGELGRREEGLEAITEAVEVYRRLADARPDAFLPDLAGSLNNLSVRLGALGRREEGLEAVTEAVEIRRRLADARPDAFLPDLAMSLNNLSVRLGALGRREEGLEAITEAVEVYRRLADARPDAFLPDLAMSLNNLSVDLGALGRREEGLEAITEAVEVYRRLADARPDAFLPDLAGSLNNLSVDLGALGRREEGLEASTEAVEIRRRLADARPDAFLPDLAGSLNNLSVDLGELGRREEGLEAITEAVEIRRRLANARPDAFLPALARSLRILAGTLAELNRSDEAEEARREAQELDR
ncbi:tetratricopeptide repeat protein [Actinomadura sp. WMMA1423]|uniref:tetratricopeptide repeat protein n=1 Tax=Actinomadura sp. WMMA1423 TaxID=2591108 RepID=UPI001F104655|nr:tetratricopeptide repeat protein [Actinomadura sp. WMMA1423]